MKNIIVILAISLLSISNLFSQEQTYRGTNPPSDYYSFRVGLWYPKDSKREYEISEGTTLKGEVDQSQAFGFDLHYRYTVGRPMFTDFSLGAWYSTYDLKNAQTSLSSITEVSAYTLFVPLTFGVSISPLTETPVHPYAMLGGGLYLAFTGRKEAKREAQLEDSKTFGHLGWYVGLGCDVMLSPAFGISAAVKYHAIEFQTMLATQQKNLSGPQVQVGVSIKR